MSREELLKTLDDLDDGQEDSEMVVCPFPSLTAGDCRYLWSLVRADIEQRKQFAE